MRYFIVGLLLITSPLLSSYDQEFWQSVKINQWEKAPFKAYFVSEVRLNGHARHPYYYRNTENFAYEACPHINLEVHYSFIREKSLNATSFLTRQRIELEANPHATFRNKTKMTSRNRLEIIKKQGVASLEYMQRSRLTFTVPIEGKGCLKSISCSEELFYNYSLKKLSQSRLIPLSVTLGLSSQLSLDLYLMVRNFYSSSAWRRSLVFGSNFNF